MDLSTSCSLLQSLWFYFKLFKGGEWLEKALSLRSSLEQKTAARLIANYGNFLQRTNNKLTLNAGIWIDHHKAIVVLLTDGFRPWRRFSSIDTRVTVDFNAQRPRITDKSQPKSLAKSFHAKPERGPRSATLNQLCYFHHRFTNDIGVQLHLKLARTVEPVTSLFCPYRFD